MFLLLTGCSTQPIDPEYFASKNMTASPKRFRICHGYGCALHSYASFSKSEWNKITSLFKPSARTAKKERQNIAHAIELMEQYTGQKTGTHTDLAQAQFKMLDRKQMDCIDETVNTDQYLHFLESNNLLVWHTVDQPIRRGYFIDGAWPHNTATIRDKETEQIWTIDSWFRANGEPPYIIPAEQWLSGWRPNNPKQ